MVDSDRLILALVQTKNEAADDVLLEALRLGSEEEKPLILAALFRRATVHGLCGVIALYDKLPEPLQHRVLVNIRNMHAALRECGRSEDSAVRIAALKLIALGHQGKLAYVLSENLRSEDPEISKAAVGALVALARWVSMETRWLQRGEFKLAEPDDEAGAPKLAADADGEEVSEAADKSADLASEELASQPLVVEPGAALDTSEPRDVLAIYNDLWAQRPEIETAVARAIDLSRGRYGPELLRAALLLCDWPGSKTLAILQTAKHGGQTAMVRRLEQPPASEHVEAFLLSASHGQIRSHMAAVFAHISERPVLDALLRKTHWLKDSQLLLCMHQVTRGAWWGESELLDDIARRDPDQAARIGDWLVASGAHDVVADDRMERLRQRAENSFPSRVRLFRLAAARKRGTSVQLIKGFLADHDERLARMAARELIRRRPPDYENLLLQRMAAAPASVRKVISRSLGHVGFEQFWERFDSLDRATRRHAGKAMLKILPDSVARLTRRLTTGPVEQRLKAMQMAHDLGLVPEMRQTLAALTQHNNPKVRSKAVSALAEAPEESREILMDRVLHDNDPRVRANAIEVLEATRAAQFLPLLAERARVGQNRERANSIKALHRMRVGNAGEALAEMLRDQRADHRISALWALRQIGLWRLLGEVGRLA
ncbi:MAG: HEAT repeat domain-containing protein, partial [Tepidisphaeraceae bacterium]